MARVAYCRALRPAHPASPVSDSVVIEPTLFRDSRDRNPRGAKYLSIINLVLGPGLFLDKCQVAFLEKDPLSEFEIDLGG